MYSCVLLHKREGAFKLLINKRRGFEKQINPSDDL